MNLEGKRILITGGSSGIGLALAKAVLAKGANVVITGRRPDALVRAVQELRRTGSSIWWLAADVALPAGRERRSSRALARSAGSTSSSTTPVAFGPGVSKTRPRPSCRP